MRDGDVIRLDTTEGTLAADADLDARAPAAPDLSDNRWGTGRELFQLFRDRVGEARHGASSLI